ncbi:MAG: ribokinase [Proteobacteria bacterium]|nr:ribokinase [Pseudomonadota bacterium]
MITVFGSLNMDILFSVEELPKPGQTILCPHYKLSPGGKGANQAVAAARSLPTHQEASVFFYGKVGEDAFGNTLLEGLEKDSICTKGVQRSKNPTGCASIYVDKKAENAIVVASGANLDVSHSQVPDDKLSEEGLLLLQLETPLLENWALTQRAYTKKCPILLNAAPAFPIPLNILKCLTTLVLNEREAHMTAQNLNLSFSSLKDLAGQLALVFKGTCVITLGPQGLIAATPDVTYTLEAFKITPCDTTGAGDTFTGALAAQVSQQIPLPSALRYASLASSLACLKEGAQPSIPFFKEVNEKLPLMFTPQEEKNASIAPSF